MHSQICQTDNRSVLSYAVKAGIAVLPFLVMIPALDIFRLSAMLRSYTNTFLSLSAGILLLMYCIAASILISLKSSAGRFTVLALFDIYGAFTISSLSLHFFTPLSLPPIMIWYRISGIIVSISFILVLTGNRQISGPVSVSGKKKSSAA